MINIVINSIMLKKLQRWELGHHNKNPMLIYFSSLSLQLGALMEFSKLHNEILGACMVSQGHNESTHCSLVEPYGNKDMDQHWVNLWLVAWWLQAITWTNVDLSSVWSQGIHLICYEQIWRYQSVKQDWKIHFWNHTQISQGTIWGDMIYWCHKCHCCTL